MGTFGRSIGRHVDAELEAARVAEAEGKRDKAFAHLERAHVLGQASTVQHVRAHWQMFLWSLRHRQARECFGQVVRLVGAATKTPVGLVPAGNTGGANVSPFKPMQIPTDLAALIDEARKPGR